MKFRTRLTLDDISEQLVQRVNELYHDFANLQYTCSHPEIFRQEKKRWERNARLFLNSTAPITIVDVGTGTGFVPLTIARFLKKEDIFICTDISEGMLDVAKQHIHRQYPSREFRFIKIESKVPFRLPLETNLADVVTLNSVLHHIKDTNTFLREVGRVLKPNGLLLIGHEPNKYFYENKFLRCMRSILVHSNYLLQSIRVKDSSSRYEICRKINRILLKEKLICSPFSVRDIERIVDIKSEEGFKPDLLLPDYGLVHIETYNNLLGIPVNDGLLEKYDNWIGERFQKNGRLFFAILRKTKSSCHHKMKLYAE
jgi:ubiquinone/menaquinone biosynthesis C-methylase UbiE